MLSGCGGMRLSCRLSFVVVVVIVVAAAVVVVVVVVAVDVVSRTEERKDGAAGAGKGETIPEYVGGCPSN
jgi:hypothetical protein